MLDLNRIPDDRLWGVICDTEQELRDFIEAVKFQRCDIDIGSFDDPRRMSNSSYHGKAYFLNYLGSKRLQHGSPRSLPRELHTLKFEELLCAPDLPDIDMGQLEALSLLGL